MTIVAMCGCAPSQSRSSAAYTYEVVHEYPHDRLAYTQELVYSNGVLYEGTGDWEHSSIRKVRLETGEVLQKRDVPAAYFGEGIVIWKDRLLELTWQNGKGFIYDLATFEPRGEFQYPGEGWGLTTDGKRIIMSDGTSQLRFLDPETLRETGRLAISDERGPVAKLNELEWVKGEVFANVWQEDRIVRIDPSTGKVTGWIDMRGLLPPAEHPGPDDVLNGIAYDAAHDRLFVTGKHWPKLFEIRVVAAPRGN